MGCASGSPDSWKRTVGKGRTCLGNHQHSAMAQIQGERESEIVRSQRKIEMMSCRVFMPSSEAEFCE